MKKHTFLVWMSIIALVPLLAGCGAAGGGGTEISVSDVGNVEGTVTDASTGTALSGVTVQIGDKTATTGSNGVFSIQDLDVGSRTITATKTGYQSYSSTCNVEKGTTVTFDIQMAQDTSGTSPSAPTGISANAGDRQVTISWDAVSGATSYNIYWSTTTGVTKTTGTKISSVTSPYTHIGLTNGTTYYYVLTAENSYGESSESSQLSATPAAPTVPIFIGLTPGDNAVYMAYNSSLSGGDIVAIDIKVNNVSNVYGAAFDVDFDSSNMTYQGYTAGSFLENGGNSVYSSLSLQSGNSGKLVVGISRQGNVSGVSGSGTLVTLKFQVAGSSTMSFSNNDLRDSNNQAISGITWYGGTVTFSVSSSTITISPSSVALTISDASSCPSYSYNDHIFTITVKNSAGENMNNTDITVELALSPNSASATNQVLEMYDGDTGQKVTSPYNTMTGDSGTKNMIVRVDLGCEYTANFNVFSGDAYATATITASVGH